MSGASDFTDLPDLASERLGGRVLAANDDFFAPKENLLRAEEPVWKEGLYTERGKWMDGWETRRRREPGHDWCLLRLGLAGVVAGVVVDTRHFKGNYPESCALEATSAAPEATAAALAGDEVEWSEILPRSPLRGDARNLFAVASPWRFTHLRLRIHPDGGVARLRVHGEPLAEPGRLAGALDLAAAEHGGLVRDWSDRFFGAPHALLLPGPALGMHDGWETRRRRGPGHDWVVVRLGLAGRVERVVVDTTHFKGNAPGSCRLEGTLDTGRRPRLWSELLPSTPLLPDTRHEFAVPAAGESAQVRLSVFPDGGVARLRILGEAAPEGRRAAALRWLNCLPPAAAAAELGACCGGRRWARGLAACRPFATLDELLALADDVAEGLAADEWRATFAAHPPIGEAAGAGHDAGARRWSQGEQAGTAAGDADLRARLADGNRRYRERFGYTFIVRAAGRGLPEILALLEARLGHDDDAELAAAAAEQRQIARLRLQKLLGETS